MSALTSLLVRDRVVSVSKIEEALQSQVFRGGDIEIILLEMNVVAEDVLSAYRAALFDLLPATREEVMRASREALRRFPPELARALGIVPIYFEGRSLVVAAWEPLYEPRLHEVETQLGCELSVRIVNQARLAAGLAHHYGFELDARLRRLLDSLRRREPGVVPYVRPPSPSMRPMVHVAELPSDTSAEGEAIESEQSGAAVPAQASPEAPPVEVPPAVVEPAPAASSTPSSLPPRPHGVSPEFAQQLHARLTLEQAIALTQQATQRDEVLFVLLRYARQLFDRVCVLSLAKEGVRVRIAHGVQASTEQLGQVLVPPPVRGLLASALRERRPLAGTLGEVPEERELAQLVHGESPRTGLVVPVELSGRVVMFLYAERKKEDLRVEHATAVQGLVPAIVSALLRLILESKQQRQRGESSRPSAPSTPAPASLVASTSEAVEPIAVSVPVPAPVPAATPVEPFAPAAELSPIDIDTLERLAREAASRRPIRSAEQLPESAETAHVRERLAGVPRVAPPPPSYLAPAAPQVASGYRYRAAVGLAHERVAPPEEAPTAIVVGQEAVAAAAPSSEPVESERRQRLSLVERVSEVPSVIIDMGESVDSLIESLLRAPPFSEPPEVAELLQVGEGVLPVLVQRFPGPLWYDRARPTKRRPRGRDVSAVARAIAAFGERAAPYLASLLGGADPDRCYYALMVAGEIVHPDLIDPVARRVLDRDESMRVLALEVLRGYSVLPQYDVVVRALADLSERPGKDPRRQRLAVEALGELRDSRALTTLIARLSDRDQEVVSAAHRALVVLTGQDLGYAARRWEAWAEGWGRAHRVEWLIESLLHNDENVRALAGEELKLLTQQYFGYHPALPRRDRELAQRKYREWWELEGRIAFGR